ncbi:natriuretic peptides A [Brachionichthys hirsutus]|uniref:natriuretic peptides A n=1 Tax=Brachionichthys hirsutus TaxID=412623 RepID=UPI0036043DC8
MRTAVLWGLLVLLWQHTPVSSHVLGRPSSEGDLARLKSLLERFEETLAEAAQQENSDYEVTDQDPEQSQAGRGWSLDQDGDQDPLISGRAQGPAEGRGRPASQRDLLQDLLMTTRKRASSCFGARMDRIGNASGLGCNTGRG